MTDTVRATTIAVGGQREVPAPDPIAADYLLLALRLDQHVPGLVDGYFGPADLKARVDLEQLRSPRRLADDADALLGRLDAEVEDAGRRDWLAAQLVALRTQATALAGDELPYVEHLRRCFSWEPIRRDDAIFDAAAARIDELLPGREPVAARLAAWDEGLVIDIDRLPAVVDWLVGTFRARAAALFGLPVGEDLRVGLVTDQPWSGYNWYEGGFRSRVDLNTDLPIRAVDLAHVIAHETYPGHHLEHARKEAELVEVLGRLEASILLINTPECLVSEGLADVGVDLVAPPATRADFFTELFERAGLGVGRAEAGVAAALVEPRRQLSDTRVNAALMRHADGADHAAVLDYLVTVGRFAPTIAAKRLEFIEHPLWRTYVFVYSEGAALLRSWLAAVPEAERTARFGRLLREQLSPNRIAAELAATPGSASGRVGSGSGSGPTAGSA